MKTSSPRNSGFTLIELLVVIAIIAILAAILFPVFARARENARRASCQSNFKQIMLGLLQYTQDYDERLPNVSDDVQATAVPGNWTYYNTVTGTPPVKFDPSLGSIYPYIKSKQIYVCPSDSIGQTQGQSYAINSCLAPNGQNAQKLRPGASMASFDETTKWMAFGEEGVATNATATTDDGFFYINSNGFTARHLDGSVLAFLDGHVKWYRPERILADHYQTGGITPASTAGGACS